MRVESPGIAHGHVAPDIAQQLLLREHARGLRRERVQQRELLRREIDGLAVEPDTTRDRVDHGRPDAQYALAREVGRAT